MAAAAGELPESAMANQPQEMRLRQTTDPLESLATRRLRVGPAQQFKIPSAAAAVAQDGDTIEIEAGEYAGDVAVWQANRLTIRGVNGFAHLAAHGNSAQHKAIWVICGNDTLVEQIEFSGGQSFIIGNIIQHG